MAEITLKQIEKIRIALQTATHQRGYADYKFERWQGRNVEIANEAYSAMIAEQANIKQLEPQLNELVFTVRQQQPALLEQWVTFHEKLVRAALVEFERDSAETPNEITRHRLEAKNLLKKWEAVRQGEQAYVLYSTGYFRRTLLEQPLDELLEE